MHMLCMMVVEIFMDVFVNKIKKDKRTGVQAQPRASLCTSSSDLHQGGDSPGAFALSGVSALKLGELV
jgi:hypothetical protein